MIVPGGSIRITADGVIKASNGQLVAILLQGGSANSTLILYDNASAASGTVVASIAALTNDSVAFCPTASLPFVNGLYADISGTGAAATIVYL